MNKINILAEQTAYLLEKQKEVLATLRKSHSDLKTALAQEQEKAEKAKATEDLKSFQHVSALLDEQEMDVANQLTEDITFLEEQLSAIKQVQGAGDEARATEIADMMLDGNRELQETATFKADVDAEFDEACSSFEQVGEEVRAVLTEEGIKELEALLVAHAMSESEDEDDEECCGGSCACDEEEDDEEAEEESCCGSSCGKKCGGCNIFSGIEVDIEEDDEPKKK